MIGSDVLGLEVRMLSRLPAPWRLRLAFSHAGERIEVDAVSAFVSRDAWAVSEIVYILAAALLGRASPSAIAKAASLRARQIGRGDGRRDVAPISHLGSAVETDRILRDRYGWGPKGYPDTRTALSWDEVSGGLGGVVAEMVEGTIGEALAAARGELVGAWSTEPARPASNGGDDGGRRRKRKPKNDPRG